MRTFAWLLFSGILWLLLIQWAQDLAVPPQLISLARSLYLGTFAVFMMVEVRRKPDQEMGGVSVLSVHNLVLYSVPAMSVLVLSWLSPSLLMTHRLWVVILGFYLLQLGILTLRSARSGMRSGIWDLLIPIVLLPLLLNDAVAVIAVILGAVLLIRHILETPELPPARGQQVSDALIMQLPSICIAPVALILLRDVLSTNSTLDRADMEMLGMIINGVGAALWSATVMRSQRLVSASVILWGSAIASAVALALVLDTSSATYVVGAMLISEALRGSLWLGLTWLLSDSRRWQGFIINGFSTALPLAALFAANTQILSQYVIFFYAAFHVLVPLSLWGVLRYRRT